jgi:hypothetical protein
MGQTHRGRRAYPLLIPPIDEQIEIAPFISQQRARLDRLVGRAFDQIPLLQDTPDRADLGGSDRQVVPHSKPDDLLRNGTNYSTHGGNHG